MSDPSNMHVTKYQGTDYVDAAELWRSLPGHLKSSSDKWTIRLKKLKICPQSCRFTTTGNINELATSKAGIASSVCFWDSVVCLPNTTGFAFTRTHS
jgi:hypothetical protein